MAQHFTLQEAERLLPKIEKALREALTLKSDYEKAEAELEGVSHRIEMTGGVLVDREHLMAQKTRRDFSAVRLKQVLDAIQQCGCVVKDIDIGLIDFPTLFRGEQVCLCWKLGEPGIEFWHGLNEGFQGRKKIDQDFLDHHQGELSL